MQSASNQHAINMQSARNQNAIRNAISTLVAAAHRRACKGLRALSCGARDDAQLNARTAPEPQLEVGVEARRLT
jgi:hypothetical protein